MDGGHVTSLINCSNLCQSYHCRHAVLVSAACLPWHVEMALRRRKFHHQPYLVRCADLGSLVYEDNCDGGSRHSHLRRAIFGPSKWAVYRGSVRARLAAKQQTGVAPLFRYITAK